MEELPILTEDEYPELYALLSEAEEESKAGLAEPWPAGQSIEVKQ